MPDLPAEKSLLRMTVCDPASVECNLGLCKECSDLEQNVIPQILPDTNTDTLCSFLQWNDKNRKVELEMPFLEAKAEFTKQMNIVRKHSFIAKVQLNQKRHCMQNLQDGKIVLQEDFSENFVMKQQGEIMSVD